MYLRKQINLTSYSSKNSQMGVRGHVNFDVNQCSAFTEYSFLLWKRFEWSKSLLVRFPPPYLKNPPAKSPPTGRGVGRISPYPLTLFGKPWYTQRKKLELIFIKVFTFKITKKCGCWLYFYQRRDVWNKYFLHHCNHTLQQLLG